MPPETDLPERWDDYRSRVRGCLLGGALGDALGAPVEFLSLADIRERFAPAGITEFAPAFGRRGAITDDTQMTLFTVEGLIRAFVRGREKGICHGPSVVWYAYRRWLHTQRSGAERKRREEPDYLDGWLVSQPVLHARRAPGNTCVSALASGRMGSPERPLNDSKGCGGVMRAAPAGLVHDWAPARCFKFGTEIAALTHGHPTGYLAAGVLAWVVREVLDGSDLKAATESVLSHLVGIPDHSETTEAVERALELAEKGVPTPEALEDLGAGWVAEEALAIALCAALTAPDFTDGIRVAVNHSGDSDSTGAIAGNLLGVALGESALPGRWLNELEAQEIIAGLADDFVRELTSDVADEAEWWERYPGW